MKLNLFEETKSKKINYVKKLLEDKIKNLNWKSKNL